MSQVNPQREKPGPVWRMFQWLGPRIITPLHVRLYRLLVGWSATLCSSLPWGVAVASRVR